jgi:hypothetical protein
MTGAVTPFNQYVAGVPAAVTPLNLTDTFYVLQNGVSAGVPASAVGSIISRTVNAATVPGPVALNLVTLVDLGTNATGSVLDAFGWLTGQVYGTRFTYTAQGNSLHNGLTVSAVAGGDVASIAAMSSAVYANRTLGGLGTGSGALYGFLSFINVGASGTVPWVIANEAEALGATGATITRRVAYSANTQGTVQGSLVDAAFVVNAQTDLYGSPAGFKDLMLVSSNFYGAGQVPLDTAGNFFRSDAAITVANFANLANVTVTGNILNFPNVVLTGAGRLGLLNTSPKTNIDVNANTSSSPSLASSTSLQRWQAADGISSGWESVTYTNGNAVGNILSGALAEGTSATPTATLTNRALWNMRAYGYNGGFQPAASIVIESAENWSSGHQGTFIAFNTTPTGSITVAQAMLIFASGGLGVGAAPADPGAGGIFATDIYSSDASFLIRTKTTLNNGASSNTGTLTNAPASGNPTKWISIDDNGTTRKIPAW